jgi:hypothetical protein
METASTRRSLSEREAYKSLKSYLKKEASEVGTTRGRVAWMICLRWAGSLSQLAPGLVEQLQKVLQSLEAHAGKAKPKAADSTT